MRFSFYFVFVDGFEQLVPQENIFAGQDQGRSSLIKIMEDAVHGRAASLKVDLGVDVLDSNLKSARVMYKDLLRVEAL